MAEPVKVGQPTARMTLEHYFPEHGQHSPIGWEHERVRDRGQKAHRISVKCSCGDSLSFVALGEVLEVVKVGFRNVKRPIDAS